MVLVDKALANAPPPHRDSEHHRPQSDKPTDQNFELEEKMSDGGQHQFQFQGDGISQEEKRMNENHDEDAGFRRKIRDLEEMLSKLNPMAEEFVPTSQLAFGGGNGQQGLFVTSPHAAATVAGHLGYNVNGFVVQQVVNSRGKSLKKKTNGNIYGKRRTNSLTCMAQREDVIRRTVYVSDIDHQITEEQLAALFNGCGQVVDCRVCGDPNSVLRFAFIEFTDEEAARNALSLAGTMLGYYPVRVLQSKTAIAPVNPTFLPRSEDEREMCARTIYCTNIDKRSLKQMSDSSSNRSVERLLGDYHHSTRIAFVEFVMAESAIVALNCSGAILGSLPIRVSPSKTPVRP